MNILYKRLGFRDLLLEINYTSIVMWWDLVAFQAFIVIRNGKLLKVKNFWANILTTKFKWVVNLFLNLLFINPMFEKHLSSSTLPITMAIDNSISFSHLNNQWEKSWLLDKMVQFFVHRLQSIGGFHGYMVIGKHRNLEKNDFYTSNASSNKGKIYYFFGPICFPK